MILGMSLSMFTTVHVIISLIAIVTGFVVAWGMLADRRLPAWTAIFLATTALTSVTGFLFPFSKLTPAHVFGLISLPVLAAALAALYGRRLSGPWRLVYVVGALLALYLNTFVGIVQGFQKLAFLQPLAPTQSEAPFLVAQIAALAIFIAVGFLAAKKFNPGWSAP